MQRKWDLWITNLEVWTIDMSVGWRGLHNREDLLLHQVVLALPVLVADLRNPSRE